MTRMRYDTATPVLSADAIAVDDNLQCRILTDFAELEGLATEWTRLQSASGDAEIFQHFSWITAWWRSLGKNCRLFTPVALRRGRVVAILPLVLDGRRLRFVGYSVSDYNHFLAEPEASGAALEACLDSLRAQAGAWDAILLENVPASSLLAGCIRGLPARWQRSMIVTPGDPCPTMLLGGDRRDVLKSSMDKLKRAVNRLRRMGDLGFRHIVDPAEAAVHLPQFFRQHIRRSAVAGRRSGFLDADYVSFYRMLVERVGPENEIRFSVLEHGGRAIAYHFGSLFHGKYFWYKPSFDVDLFDLAPGQAMLWHLFDYLQTAGAREFDFGRGDETFKYRFSNHVRNNIAVVFYASRGRAAVARAGGRMRESIRRMTRKSPRLERAAKAARAAWQDARRTYGREGGAAAWRKLLRAAVFDREVLWVFSVEPSPRNAPETHDVSVREISLGGLADLALACPELLDEEVMNKAREFFRQKKTAWIATMAGSERMLLWTSIDAELTAPAGAVLPLPDRTMLVHEIRPVGPGASGREAVAVLRKIAANAAAAGLGTWAVCPARLLPSGRALHDAGMNPRLRWTRTRILGKTYWKIERPG
jgi:CelD/BcsL family acetyltransferase involved in cellulose biosynthesis